MSYINELQIGSETYDIHAKNIPTVTDDYDAESGDAMSGKAVASAIASMPTITSGTTDLEEGATLASGSIYLVYEE